MQPRQYKLFATICLFFCISCIYTAQAQCTGRYLDTTTFSAIDSFSNVVYTDSAGGDSTELMDIYQPDGDTACLRHLVIWVHGGAFFEGSKNDGDVTLLCRRFAQRGYVSASINYRLAPSLIDLYDSTQIFKFAMQACSDLKAAIRFFYKDALHGNHYNIDTTSIFIGGSSAGGIACDFAATINNLNQLATVFQPVAVTAGGIAGNSGNTSYSSNFIAVASLAGAVNTADWIEPGDAPTIMCQGTADGTIPYYCGQALQQYTYGLVPTIIDFCGSGSMKPAFDSAGVINSLLPFPGSGHVPWDTNTTIMNRTDSAIAAFFYQIKCSQINGSCTSPAGIDAMPNTAHLSVYPNPAADIVQISILDQNELRSVALSDCTGREIRQQTCSAKSTSLALKGLTPGIYLLRIYTADSNTIPSVRKLIIE